jgi:hypothetical protein
MADELRALSIQQPWVNHILYDGKRVENRSWYTRYRGPLFLHAAKTTDGPLPAHRHDFVRSALCGLATVVDCLRADQTLAKHPAQEPWIYGPYCIVLAKVRPIRPILARGYLSIYPLASRPCPAEVIEAAAAELRSYLALPAAPPTGDDDAADPL